MEAYQQRVVDEKSELDTKITALETFIESDKFEDIDGDEQDRLIEQLDLMQQYSTILADRIENFS